jgi:peptide-methionine (S)-S-oxide reductase
VEGAFTPLRGVDSAVSGYLNGAVANPTYEAVCSGRTGHAEAVEITFDPAVLPFKRVLDIFFTVHDPTQLNRQGNDYGTQYRSGIYYHNDAQRDAANAYIREQQAAYSAPIVTEVVPAQVFYPAEDYHQNYFEKNPNAGYCRAVVRPKVDKVRAKFAELL